MKKDVDPSKLINGIMLDNTNQNNIVSRVTSPMANNTLIAAQMVAAQQQLMQIQNIKLPDLRNTSNGNLLNDDIQAITTKV